MILSNPIETFFDANKSACMGIYFCLIVVVLVVTTLLERLCVQLKNKAKLSSGVVAGILLGVITSLPELVTCLTSVIESQRGDIGFGDIIGSNIFDLFVMCACLLVCVKLFIDHKSNKINIQTLFWTGIGTIFCFCGALFGEDGPIFNGNSPLVWHGFNFFSILIIICYGFAVFFMTRDAKVKTVDEKKAQLIEAKKARQSKLSQLSLRWIIALIAIVGSVLVVASVFLTYTSSSLILVHWKHVLGPTFGGNLLLGLVTSLPEVVCCINLCIHKEYNMVIDTIVGSCTFNLAILTIANIGFACVWQKGSSPMYPWKDGLVQLIVCMLIIATALVYLMMNRPKFKAKLTKKQEYGINISLLSLVVIEYSIFMILGFVYQ